jgi:uncharacterized protein YdaU (DUF1376 family)
MNHFPFHIGDYAEATGHLSFVEDATYFRCIRKYYSTEKALPREISQVQRLIGAKTKEEKNSVEVVLNEFFILEEDGWHNKRCDQELERYHEGSHEDQEKKQHEKERLRRYREERSLMFKALREFGVIPKWDTPMETLRRLFEQNCNAPETGTGSVQERNCNAPDTSCDTAITNQEPITNNQEPNIKPKKAAPSVDSDFENAWGFYPKRPGASKAASLKAWKARIKAGVDPSVMVEGVKRYANFCKTLETDAQFIKQPATFFGPDEHYLADWTPSESTPKTKELPLGTDAQIEHAYRVECGGDPKQSRFASYPDMRKFILDWREKRKAKA